ncbi:glycosyltransferase [Luteipulveratus halotolerans]|uniref:Glycosyltransferase 2-like domain-containing protein n=1 Tax=Luteipulveratus halotolerans TaxID=1631356 RepID=A0A0L6CE84_9MICO|nr:glycosyltransferase [Luteipulveratus halotolerans]KNX36186.1 hypothetical protein VV01_01925 [Luteipulveratus halotolerans]
MAADRPWLSVGVVAYNAPAEMLDRCIASVRAEATRLGRDVQVVVVDNASPRPVLERPEWRAEVVRSGDNLGFGRACNLMIEHARSDLVLLLNPDAWLVEGSLDAVLAMESDATPALYSGYLMAHGAVQVDAYWHWWTSTERALRRRRVAAGVRAIEGPSTPVGKVCGGALLARTDVLRALGPFNPDFFLYGEDADLSLRAAAAGHALLLLRELVVGHEAAFSMKESSVLVEQARADATMRLAALHRSYPFALWVRLDLACTTIAGTLGGRTSVSAASRMSRLRQVRRWGVRRYVARLDPNQVRVR